MRTNEREGEREILQQGGGEIGDQGLLEPDWAGLKEAPENFEQGPQLLSERVRGFLGQV